MRFPVNRAVGELSIDELLSIYDSMPALPVEPEARAEIRAEMRRRMEPCKRAHASSQYELMAQQLLGQSR